jgi:amino acid transporter
VSSSLNYLPEVNEMEKPEPKVKDETRAGGIDGFLPKYFSKIIEINKKYATPKIKMTKWVRISLLGLRIYLIVLVLILVYKFFTLVK